MTVLSKRRRKKHKKNKKGLSIIAFIVVVFCICVGVRTNQLKTEQEELAKKQEAIEKEIAEEEKRTKELEEQEKYMGTKKYMEDVAKEKLGLVYPDEILIEPKGE